MISAPFTKRLAFLVLLNALGILFLVQGSVPAFERKERFAGSTEGDRLPLLEAYGNLPLSFEKNQGQTSPQVEFLSRGGGYTLFLNPNEAVLRLQGAKPETTEAILVPSASGADASTPDTAVLRLTLVGSNSTPRVSGYDQLPSRSNYFIGRDRDQWRTNIPHYRRVLYEEVYPCIDLVYYGNMGQLEYDFLAAPGADIEAIRMRFEGAQELKLSEEGDLILSTAGGEVRLHKPVVYQEVNGARREVEGDYFLVAKDQVGFAIGSYDPTRTLVIDPVLVYSTHLGSLRSGGGYDVGVGIAVDASGSAYVVGVTKAIDFPTTNALQPSFGGGFTDVFVTKLSADGTQVIYSTYLGGSDIELGNIQGRDLGGAIAVDPTGNAYITALTGSSDFPIVNPLQSVLRGGRDAFVSKISPDGSALLYSTYLGGSGNEWSYDIALDGTGNAYVTGFTTSRDFPTVNFAQQSTSLAGSDRFVSKLSADGSSLVFSTYLGGSDGRTTGYGVAVDSTGRVHVAGVTTATDFPIKNPVQGHHAGGGNDAFATVLSPEGNVILHSTFLGGDDRDQANDVTVDTQGNTYVTGWTESDDFPADNNLQALFNRDPRGRGRKAFLTKIDANGSILQYSSYLGSGEGNGVAVDQSGNVYVVGLAESTEFLSINASQLCLGGDAFVLKIGSNGSDLAYSTCLGEDRGEEGIAIAVDSAGDAYVTGRTNSPDFPAVNPIQMSGVVIDDAFVTRLTDLPNPPPPTPVVSLTVEPSSITFGESAVLRWTSSNASIREISPTIGRVAAEGASGVSPDRSTTYTLVGRNIGGSAEVSVRLEVNVPTPTDDCVDISGTWRGEESGSLTCTVTAPGLNETETDPYEAIGTVTIEQGIGSCSFHYDPVFPGGGSSFQPGRRSGEIDGDRLTVSGPFALQFPGVGVATLNTNTFEGAGQVQENRTINLTGSGRLVGAVPGDGGVIINLECTGNSSATLTRISPPRVLPGAPILQSNSAVNGANFLAGPLAPDSWWTCSARIWRRNSCSTATYPNPSMEQRSKSPTAEARLAGHGCTS